MNDVPVPSRTSGAPPWAVRLGLGTAEESAARPQSTKWAVRVLWVLALTPVLIGYLALRQGVAAVTVGAMVFCVFLAALIVASWSFGTSLYLRRHS